MTLVVIFYYQYLFIVQDNSNMALLSEKKFSKECVRVCVKVIIMNDDNDHDNGDDSAVVMMLIQT